MYVALFRRLGFWSHVVIHQNLLMQLRYSRRYVDNFSLFWTNIWAVYCLRSENIIHLCREWLLAYSIIKIVVRVYGTFVLTVVCVCVCVCVCVGVVNIFFLFLLRPHLHNHLYLHCLLSCNPLSHHSDISILVTVFLILVPFFFFLNS